MNLVRDSRRFAARIDKMQALFERKTAVLVDQVLRHMVIPAFRQFELTLYGDRDGLWFQKPTSSRPASLWSSSAMRREHPELAPLIELLFTPIYPGSPRLLGHLVLAVSPTKTKRRAVRQPPPRGRLAKLAWQKHEPDVWLSGCGRYKVWIQARVRDGNSYEREYSSSLLDNSNNGNGRLLCNRGTFAEAKGACQEHADRQERST
jgi:hypothetical protein